MPDISRRAGHAVLRPLRVAKRAKTFRSSTPPIVATQRRMVCSAGNESRAGKAEQVFRSRPRQRVGDSSLLASVLTRLRAAGAPRLPPVVAASASFLTPETAMAAFRRYVEIAPAGFARSTSPPP